MLVRLRTPDDTDDLLGLVLEVHRHDLYPRYPPHDMADFILSGNEEVGWVAEIGGRVVGHVALHRAIGSPTLPIGQRTTGLGPESLVMLARLMVAPAVRRRGVARALIAGAMRHARSCGRQVILDVAVDADAAIGLYNTLGWVRAERLELRVGNGQTLDVWVYINPPLQSQPLVPAEGPSTGQTDRSLDSAD